CSSVPAVSAHQCHVPVPISATHQCQSVLPISATYQCCQSVPPIRVMYQGHVSGSCISAAFQCPSVMPVNTHQCNLPVPPHQFPSVPPIS
ncbi:unnamed protein product, partial [Staurois parvus]